MSDEDLLGYFEIHSRTERALFSREQIVRLFELAGRPAPDGPQSPAMVSTALVGLLVLKARARATMIELDDATRSAAEARHALTSVLFQLQDSGLKSASFDHPLVAHAIQRARDAERCLDLAKTKVPG